MSNVALIASDSSFPLEAKLIETSKMIKVRVTYSRTNRTSGASFASSTSNKSTPTRADDNPSPETPSIPRKKFVTPTTAAASTIDKYCCKTPDAVESATYAKSSAKKSRTRSSKMDRFREYSLQAAEFEKRKNTPFPEILHAMVSNATLTVPDVLHWNADGDRFVIENVVGRSVNVHIAISFHRLFARIKHSNLVHVICFNFLTG
jgi:hypothetical protein